MADKTKDELAVLKTANDQLQAQVTALREQTNEAATMLDDLQAQLNEALAERRAIRGEAGISLNFPMLNAQGAQVGVTLRWHDLTEHEAFMAHVKTFVTARVKDSGWKVLEKIPQANAAAPALPTLVPAPQAQANGGAPVPPPGLPAAPQQEIGEAKCAMIEIAASFKGNKTQIKFHCDGLEHPLTYTREPSDMVKLMAPLGFTNAHFVVGTKYPVPCRVKWAQAEKYKNVLSVRPA